MSFLPHPRQKHVLSWGVLGVALGHIYHQSRSFLPRSFINSATCVIFSEIIFSNSSSMLSGISQVWVNMIFYRLSSFLITPLSFLGTQFNTLLLYLIASIKNSLSSLICLEANSNAPPSFFTASIITSLSL